MMKKNVSISISFRELGSRLGKIVRRYHLLLFFLAVSSGLFVSIAILLPITSLSSSEATSSEKTLDTSFDQATIQRLQSKSSSNPSAPGQRKNPFSE